MRFIRQFIKLLEKQGLQHGRLVYPPKEYVYSKEKGIQEIELDTAVIDIPEPKSEKKVMEIDLEKEISLIDKKRKQTRTLYPLFFILLVVVGVLFVGVIYLNNKMSQRETDPVGIVEETGDKKDLKLLPLQIGKGAEGEKEKKRTVVPKTEKKKEIVDTREYKKPEGDSNRPVESEDEKNRDRDKTLKPQPFQSSVTIRDISPDLIGGYSKELKTLRIDLPRKVKVSGYFHINLFIDETGQVSLFQYNDSGIVIQPESKRNRVILRLKQMISGLQFQPPRDKNGQRVKLENWRLNFQVTQFKQRMILRMQ